MPERIITDGNGDRWDVRQDRGEEGRIVFRHQSGRTVTLEVERPLDQVESEELLAMLRESGREQGMSEEGSGADLAADPSGYVTRPQSPDRPEG